MRARDVMTRDVVSVHPATTVKQAAKLLADNGFTALPVVEGDQLVGIVSEADLVRDRFPVDPRYRYETVDAPNLPVPQLVREVMSAPATDMGPGTDVTVLARAMLDDKHRFMPIVDGGALVGVVTRRDLIKVLARPDEEIAREVTSKLESYGGPSRWTVAVHDGEAVVHDEFDDATDRHIALVLAEAVPGVVRATVHSAPVGPA
ncbi:CBS domain-containing protein [Labedaea rhizosphaerae]|uniref:CBS domain protein n=1 Tax=Labedaea rhizosphaerae TaxID=598644 RepID=A0A4R6S2F9_LABRH|nr:CBS domain-containing protein [Labedaea rhizosphaerae]TDP92845.1 CBS domain protein [Labedaea rhizosphaerae]